MKQEKYLAKNALLESIKIKREKHLAKAAPPGNLKTKNIQVVVKTAYRDNLLMPKAAIFAKTVLLDFIAKRETRSRLRVPDIGRHFVIFLGSQPF